MCGRFAYHSPISVLKKRFNIETVEASYVGPSYNTAPTNKVLAVVKVDQARLVNMTWGIVPSWALKNAKKKGKKPTPLINARSETVHEKPSFKKAFQTKRCLVIADGYYEWENTPSGKSPWYITHESGEPFAFAGLYQESAENNEADEPKTAQSCILLTAAADTGLIHIHDRMPVILPPPAQNFWLDLGNDDMSLLLDVIASRIQNEFLARPVSKKVNNVRSNDSSLISPALREKTLF